jgi:sec-independent protein translocase protein TatB
MSGIGSSEFILLLVIGLIVLGPKRLPEIANKIGGWIGQARRMTRVMKRQLEEELNFDEHRNLLPPSPPFSQETSNKPSAPPPTQAEGDPELNPEPPAVDQGEGAESAETSADHIPNDDDTYSPLHGGEETGETAKEDGSASDEGQKERGA